MGPPAVRAADDKRGSSDGLQENYGIFGGFQDESTQRRPIPNTSGTVFAMALNDDLKANRDFVRQLEQGHSGLRAGNELCAIKGRTFIELNQQQLSTVGNAAQRHERSPSRSRCGEPSSDRISNFYRQKMVRTIARARQP